MDIFVITMNNLDDTKLVFEKFFWKKRSNTFECGRITILYATMVEYVQRILQRGEGKVER